jgi:predicted nucleotidyltransferase
MKQVSLHSKPGFDNHDSPSSLEQLAACQESIIKALAYFDIFHYPLLKEEINIFLDKSIHPELLDKGLNSLLEESTIYLHHGYYLLQDNHLLTHRRTQGNKKAEDMLVKAMKIGRFLYQFPFVRSIGVSGSLSKNFAEENSDIDFFIITKGNRLWIARTIMQIITKIALLRGRQHFYCMNYYIDENALLLPERNIFTAIELKTLLPVAGEKMTQRFFETNHWVNNWLPACDFRPQPTSDPASSWLKRIAEWMLGSRLFNPLENYLFRSTTRRWQEKERKGKTNDKGHVLNLLTGKHFARTNPDAFQEKVLLIYEQKLAAVKSARYAGMVTISSAT